MIGELLAAATAGPQVDGAWVTGFVVAILGGIGTMLGYTKGRKTRTQVEPNPLPVAMVQDLATKEELRELEGRLVSEIKKLETAISSERSVARTANGNLHARIDKIAEGLAGTTATMTQLNASLNRVLDALLKPNRRTSP